MAWVWVPKTSGVPTVEPRQPPHPPPRYRDQAPEPEEVPVPPWRKAKAAAIMMSQPPMQQVPPETDYDSEHDSAKSEQFSEPGDSIKDEQFSEPPESPEAEPPSLSPELSPEAEPPEQPDCLSVYVQTLARSIDEDAVLENVLNRVQERGSTMSMCLWDDELFLRMRTPTQLNRVFTRLHEVVILQGTVTLRSDLEHLMD